MLYKFVKISKSGMPYFYEFDRDILVKLCTQYFNYIHTASNRVCLLVEGRGSRVTSRGSRVNGRGSRVNGRGSRVNGRGSRVTSRGSKNSSQLFLNIGKSNFRGYSSFRFLFYFTLTPSGTKVF